MSANGQPFICHVLVLIIMINNEYNDHEDDDNDGSVDRNNCWNYYIITDVDIIDIITKPNF